MDHRPWSTILIVANAVAGAVAAAALVVGIVSIVRDLSSHTDWLDGLGVFIGVALIVVALIVGAAAVTVAMLTLRGRRRAEGGDAGMLFAAGVCAVVCGAIPILVLVALAASGIGQDSATATLLLLAAVPFAGYITVAARTVKFARFAGS